MITARKSRSEKKGWFRRLLAFVGPAYLVSVGYMDPGNWATDIEGGARFGYMLLWVLLMSNLMAVLLQTLAARMGIVTGLDLAQGCRREYSRPVNLILWFLAEALGTVVGLNLLFGIPLLWGCAITGFNTFLLLALQRMGMRKMEAFIVMLVATIGSCFLIEVYLAKPDWGGIAAGFVPHLEPSALFVAIGMIGATVMPHNLYLHSSLVQSPVPPRQDMGKRNRQSWADSRRRSLHGDEDYHYLETLTREMEEQDLPVEFMLLSGRPADQLVKAARDEVFDMMIMGSQGHRGLDDLVFGQTVTAVRHDLTIPVLIVRSYDQEQAQRT